VIEIGYFCRTCYRYYEHYGHNPTIESSFDDKEAYDRHMESEEHLKGVQLLGPYEKKREEQLLRYKIKGWQQREKTNYGWSSWFKVAICRNGCQYREKEEYFSKDGYGKEDWVCGKCHAEKEQTGVKGGEGQDDNEEVKSISSDECKRQGQAIVSECDEIADTFGALNINGSLMDEDGDFDGAIESLKEIKIMELRKVIEKCNAEIAKYENGEYDATLRAEISV
jgi:hypothetical protein